MSNSITGYWTRPSDPDEETPDFLWIGDNGRIVHRINYAHGPFVMTLWSQNMSDDTYEVKLKPKSEPHRVILKREGDSLKMEHLDLKSPNCEFTRIEEAEIPKVFEKDLAWAEKNMNKAEK